MAENGKGTLSKGMKTVIAVLVLLVVVLALVVSQLARQCVNRPGETGTQGRAPSAAQPAKTFPDMADERMADEGYRAALKALTDERRETAIEARKVAEQMRVIVAASTQTLRQQGGEVSAEQIEAHARKQPDWPPLEAKRTELETKLADIQARTQKTISDRMNEQYAARRGAISLVSNRVAVSAATNTIEFATEPIIVTNKPGTPPREFPASPVRKPAEPKARPAVATELDGENN